MFYVFRYHTRDAIAQCALVGPSGRPPCKPGTASADAPARIAAIIESADFPVRDDYADMAVRRAFDLHPQTVANALAHRIAAGLELPFRAKPTIEHPLRRTDRSAAYRFSARQR
jgi:hypothetical protein